MITFGGSDPVQRRSGEGAALVVNGPLKSSQGEFCSRTGDGGRGFDVQTPSRAKGGVIHSIYKPFRGVNYQFKLYFARSHCLRRTKNRKAHRVLGATRENADIVIVDGRASEEG